MEALFLLFPLIIFGVMMVFGVAVMAFWIWMIVDCATNEPDSPDNTKIVWLLVTILAGWIGAIIYYFARRPKRIAEHGK